ncbi:FkbM family methyltransferase [Rhodanobacter sp. T12-5]|uniref:FkbM family methyltransferase n=1 Tax=Rhodanobacter sp. T12-5 TaxID=2024611 RepID=UPI0011ED54D7|nr:FkbM family methyltransferase [Rhodanobacter sp. T12-5]KAA0072046.1 FkbM family methyltransferase [Rhodanobacter sp. T12-5]
MTQTSYAQNYEDIMLLRALHDVTSGFYIDVGAQDPVNDSVTKAFYERGWHGVNIEPVSHWFERLVADRAHDINLQLAVSDSPGCLHLYEVENSGLSTTDPEFAKRHIAAGLRVTETDVPCVTLDAICDAHDVREVHFLKVDCEGAEAAVFRGFSFQRVRPWVILVEATEPNTQRPAYADWDPILVGHGYRYVYEDGLNRFYVAEEHNELCAAFVHPPNVFDRFVRAPEVVARLDLQRAQLQLDMLTNAERGIRAELERDSLQHQNAELHSMLAARDAEISRLSSVLAASDTEIGRLNSLLTESNTEISQLNSLLTESNTEIGRLHHEVKLRDGGIAAIEHQLLEHRRSTSWLLTAPLRFCVRAIRAWVLWLKAAPYNLLRRTARCARPLLRKIAKWSWTRAMLRSLLGDDSRLANRGRLFLYGERGRDEFDHSHGAVEQLNVNWEPTRDEERMRSILNRAWRRKGWLIADSAGMKGGK